MFIFVARFNRDLQKGFSLKYIENQTYTNMVRVTTAIPHKEKR